MKPFTIVLPIKGTDEEINFYRRSIESAIKLNPDEIIIAVDYPFPDEWKIRVNEIFQENSFTSYVIEEIKKDADWNFQLANVLWNVYAKAKNDVIYSFDIDSVVRKSILKGLDAIGNDNIALISFTKKTRMKSLQDLIRYLIYRLRVRTTEYTFSGNYFIFRPYFYDLVVEDEYKKIVNGVDTYITEKILAQEKYKMVTRKEIGVNALTLQNEDYDWRQFQDGVWYYANKERWAEIFSEEKKKKGIQAKRYSGLLYKHPLLYVLLKSFAYQRFGILEGFLWAKKNKDDDLVKLAQKTSLIDWGYMGATKVRWIKQFKDVKTGFG